MEDRICAHASLPIEQADHTENLAYFGVYDGHNGGYVADMLQARMHLILLSHIAAANAIIAECEGIVEGKSNGSHFLTPTSVLIILVLL